MIWSGAVSDDTMQTSPIDPLEARVVVFRQQPEAKGFAALRQELRDAGRGELLAELCATWAQHERDPVRAADAWSEAGEAMVVLGETATAIEYLRTALELDPTNDRALDRLLEIVEPDDPAAAVEILEAELAELRASATARPRGKKPELVARRARACTAAPPSCGTTTSAASIARCGTGSRRGSSSRSAPRRSRPRASSTRRSATTRWSRKLYQAELEVLGAAGARRAQGARSGSSSASSRCARKDLEAAANHLEEAARLDPTSLEIAEALAEVYATPGFRDGQTRHKAGELFVELGRQRLATRDDATGINYLRRAVGVDPYAKRELAGARGGARRDARSGTSSIASCATAAQVVAGSATSAPRCCAGAPRCIATSCRTATACVEVLTELVAYEAAGQQGRARAAASCCARTRSGSSCRA